MKFDFKNVEPPRASGTRTDEVLPAGTYVAEITKAADRQSEYAKTDANPEGWEVSLWLDIEHEGRRVRKFDSVKRSDPARMNEYLDACNLPALAPNQPELNPEVLEGHTVAVEVWIKRSGKNGIGMVKLHANNPAATKPAPKRAGKVAPNADGIPF
jgi:hypothetical protein